MKIVTSPLVAVIVVLGLITGVPAPIPRCAPGRFVNRVIESDELAWVTGDLPGHPVEPCPYENPKDAPTGEKSLLKFFLKDKNRITDEARSELDFWTVKGLSRINERWWDNWDYYASHL